MRGSSCCQGGSCGARGPRQWADAGADRLSVPVLVLVVVVVVLVKVIQRVQEPPEGAEPPIPGEQPLNAEELLPVLDLLEQGLLFVIRRQLLGQLFGFLQEGTDFPG